MNVAWPSIRKYKIAHLATTLTWSQGNPVRGHHVPWFIENLFICGVFVANYHLKFTFTLLTEFSEYNFSIFYMNESS